MKGSHGKQYKDILIEQHILQEHKNVKLYT